MYRGGTIIHVLTIIRLVVCFLITIRNLEFSIWSDEFVLQRFLIDL